MPASMNWARSAATIANLTKLVPASSYAPDWSEPGDWDGKSDRDASGKVNATMTQQHYQRRRRYYHQPLLLPQPQSSTMVMGLVWHYQLDVMSRFIDSLRRHYSGDVLMLLPWKPPAGIRSAFAAARVTEVPVPPIGDIAVERFRDYARVCVEPYQLCLASDVRDVFFQADPFASMLGVSDGRGGVASPDLLLSEEVLQIGECPHNSQWIHNGWGPEELRAIGNHSVINSGVVIGSPRGLRKLADLMPATRPHVMAKSASRFRRPLFGGWWDQPTLEYLARHDDGSKLAGLRVVHQPRGRGVVNTIGVFGGYFMRKRPELNAMAFASQHMDHRGIVLNDDGTPSAIVHQYDRLERLNVSFGALIPGRGERDPRVGVLDRCTVVFDSNCEGGK